MKYVQQDRFTTTGATPVAGARATGELWLNMPDNKLGYIDGSGNPQPLTAVKFFSVNANYAIGDYVVQSGQLYRAIVAVAAGAFNVSQWDQVMTAQTTAQIIGDNRIINGDMRIDQRNNGASGTAVNVYTVDRWEYAATQTSKGTWQQSASTAAAIAATGFAYALSFISSSAYASLVADYFAFLQRIEADMVSDFAWGTAGAKTITLSFWVYSSLNGTFSGSITNATQTRSYPFTYSVPAANTWTNVIVTIPGDTGGTWVINGNACSMIVWFDLGSGTNGRGPAGTWAGTSYIGVTGSVSVVGTNGATFFVTGVKLEIGSNATPFNRYSLAKSLADCQRYHSVMNHWFSSYAAAGAVFGQSITYPVTMRTVPTITAPGGFTYTNASGFTVYQATGSNAGIYATATVLGQAAIQCTLILDAEF